MKTPTRGAWLFLPFVVCCGARTSLELARGSSPDSGGSLESGGSSGASTGGVPTGGASTGGVATGGMSSSNSDGGTGGSEGGTGGAPMQPTSFCPLDFGRARTVDLWAGASELFLVLEDDVGTGVWSKAFEGGEWNLLWRADALLGGVPSLTGFPEGGPLAVYGVDEPCGIMFLDGGELTCSAMTAPVYDLHVVSSTDAYAVTGDSIIRYTGGEWVFANALPDAGEFQLATSVWADEDTLLVATDWSDSALIYAAREGSQELRGELSVQNETFTNVEASGGSEWLLTKDGELYVQWEGASRWYLFTFWSGECSDFQEVWLQGPARYVRNQHSVTRLDDSEILRLVDLPCEGTATISSAVTTPTEDLYVAILDSAVSACSGVFISKWNGESWSHF